MALLDARKLSITYLTSDGRRVEAARNVSFHLAAGEFVSLVGGSGSGKSTVALALARLTDFLGCETGGELLLDGEPVFQMTEPELRRLRREKIAYVFQDPSASLNPVMRIETQILEAMPHPNGEGVLQLLRDAQILDAARVARAYPHQLSGGMKQRAAIAMALAKNPTLLVADEPTTALDAVVQKEILALFLELRKKRGLTTLLITHDLNIARAVSDRVLVMNAGCIVDEASAPNFALSDPYAVKLLGAASAGEHPKTFFEV